MSQILHITPGHIALGARIFRRGVVLLSAVLIVLLGRSSTKIWLDAETSRASLEAAVQEVGADSPVMGVHPSAGKGDAAIRGLGEKKLFGELGRAIAPPQPTPVVATAPLPLKLVGTYVSSLPEDSYAIIEQTQRSEQDVFGVGESVFDVSKLISIGVDRVVVDYNGKREQLALIAGSADAGSGGTNGTRVVVAERDVDEALSNLPVLLTQLRAVPYFKNGQAVGLRLFAIKSGSLFEKIGLRNGDILQTINGNQLGDFSQALQLFEKLKSERSLKVVLERNRQEMAFDYQIQ